MAGSRPACRARARGTWESTAATRSPSSRDVESVEGVRRRQGLPPVGRFEPILAHSLAGGRDVNELPVAHVDADVRVALALKVEKQQIAVPKMRHAKARGGLPLLRGAARKNDARLAEAELDQPAAIETGAGSGAAGPVGPADHLRRECRSAVRRAEPDFYARCGVTLRACGSGSD